MLSHLVLVTLLFTSIHFYSGCVVGQEKTVPGPESDQLLPLTTGYLLIDRSSREITAIELPSLKETIVRPTRPADPTDDATIHALSGPDAEGRIAYIEDHFFVPNEKDRRHLLKVINLDGTGDRELFSRPGDAMWAKSAAGNGEIGDQIALSPVGGCVAFLSALKSVQMPSALLHVGSVEIWDVARKVGRQADFEAVDHGLAWFPDGRRLAYVKLVERRPATVADERADSFGKFFENWHLVPSVFIRDIDAGTESFLHVGSRPVVSPDGHSVLVTDLNRAWKLVDVATGTSNSATWSDRCWPGAIAMPAKDVVLSWCLPTAGARIKFTKRNSPLVGPKQMIALKLARVNSDEFQTVVPHVDPRDEISFGVVRKSQDE